MSNKYNIKIRGMEPEDWLREKILEAIVHELDELEKDHVEDPTKVYVTDLVYGCPRRAWLARKYGSAFTRADDILRIWIGNKIHATPILANSELKVEWENIKGRVDEYEEGILVEKKSTTNVPRYGPWEPHKKQLQYYRVLLEMNGYPVFVAFVLYFDLTDLSKFTIYQVQLGDFEELKKEMLERRDQILPYLNSNEIPPRRPSWICRYCHFTYLCYTKSKKVLEVVGLSSES